MDQALDTLRRHQLRKTQIRLEVLSIFLKYPSALSHAEIEREMEEVDRITLYRTLKTFEENGIIHKAFDGTEKARYALCHSGCVHTHHEDDHAHFSCGRCGKTFCLDNVQVPQVPLPDGYTQATAHLIIKGTCESCTS